MKEPSLKVIGVYRPVISAETLREQYQVTGDEQITQEHFAKLVLIEAVVEGVDGSVSSFIVQFRRTFGTTPAHYRRGSGRRTPFALMRR